MKKNTSPASTSFGGLFRQAFTLLELLVVIAITAILAALLFPVASNMLKSSRQSACAQNLKQVGSVCGLYSADHNGNIPPQYDMGVTLSSLLAPYAGGMKDIRIAPDVFYCPENVAQNTPPAGGYRITSTILYKGWSGYFVGYLMNSSIHTLIYLDADELARGVTTPSRRAVKQAGVQMPSKTVSLMDLVPWPQGGAPPSSGLARDYYFNPDQPSFSLGVPHRGYGNVLFCDGHVEAFSDREKLPVASLPSQTETWW